MKSAPIAITIEDLTQHRDALKSSLELARQKETQAKLEVDRMTGAVAGIEVLITKLTAAPAPAPQS